MSVSIKNGQINPSIVTNGLVFYTDPKNTISYSDYNLCQYTEQFESWSPVNLASITINSTTAPDGNLTADKLINSTSANTLHVVYRVVTTIQSKYTVSCWAKAAEYPYFGIRIGGPTYTSTIPYVVFNITGGTVVQSNNFSNINITNAGNGWFFLSVTFDGIVGSGNVNFGTLPTTYNIDVNGQFNSTGDGVSGGYIWGAQVTLGATLRPYRRLFTSATTINNMIQGQTLSGALNSGVGFDGNSNLFNGTSNRIVYPKNTLTNTYTWDFWVKANSISQTYNMIFGMYLPYLAVRAAGGIMYSNVIGGSQTNIFSADGLIQLNTWYNIVISVDNSNSANTVTNIYLNGVLVKTETDAGAIVTTTNKNLNIGYWNDYPTTPPDSYFWNGNIGCTKLYNRVLSPSEILQNYNALKTRFV